MDRMPSRKRDDILTLAAPHDIRSARVIGTAAIWQSETVLEAGEKQPDTPWAARLDAVFRQVCGRRDAPSHNHTGVDAAAVWEITRSVTPNPRTGIEPVFADGEGR